MRVLLLCHGLPPDSVGGVEQHTSGLAAALAAAGHEVHTFARADLPGLDQGQWTTGRTANPRVTRVAYRWQGVDSLEATYTCAPMAAALRRFLGERRAAGETFDVAHVHHLTGMSIDALDELAAAGLPTVLTLHDYWLFCPRGQMFHRRGEVCERAEVARCAECLEATFPHWLDAGNREATVRGIHARARRALELPQRLVVPSARAIAPFEALGVARDRFTVVENGVDTGRLHELEPPPAGPGPLRVGYFGTLLPSKGLHVLLDAVLGLPPGTVTVHVHGNAVPYHGDESYLLRCLARLRPGSGVTYGGPYSADELPRLLDAVDVVAAPALWHEAYGLTVREALAASRPVLVSRIGGLQDAVADGEQGRVLPPGDVAAWREAIAALAADRTLVQRWARAARPRARGFAAMAADLLAVYAAACAGAVPGHRPA